MVRDIRIDLDDALKGRLEDRINQEKDEIGRATQGGVKETVEWAKQSLRDQVTGAGMGQRLARTWRSRVYPSGGPALGAAGIVWSNAPKIIEAYDRGVTIKSKDGLFLAIPSENAPRRAAFKKITPESYEQTTGNKLRFVYRRNGPSMLVADGLRASISRKTGQLRGFRNASERAKRTGTGLVSVPIFYLVPRVRVPKRLNVRRVAEQAQARLPGAIARRLAGRN